MRFGLFMAPFHPTGQNPTLALQRDLELIEHLDRLGFHEVWVGEHHSGGYEIISSPEVFIAAAAERTKHVRFGSGVNSLPYHQPLMLADRFVLLDHLTRGRVMLGCGPGTAHVGRAHDGHSRRRAASAYGRSARRDHGAAARRVGHDADRLVHAARRDAATHAVQRTDRSKSPSPRRSRRPGARAAGKHGIGLLSIAATTKQGFDAIGTHWNTWNQVAEQHGNTARREQWRLVGPMHLAETKEQARKDVEYGIVPFSKYFTHVLPAGPTRGDTAEEIVANVDEDGFAVIGTPDDAIAKIQSLVDESGGFGTFLLFGHDWADPNATKRSFELFAQYVMPHFTGQLVWPDRSCEWVTGSGGEFVNRAANAIMKAIADHAAEQQPAG